MTWRAPGTLASSPEFRFRYGSLLVVLVGVMVTSVVTLLLSPGWNFSASDRLGLGLLALKNVALTAWLWRRPDHFARIGLIELVIEGAAGLVKLWSALLVDQTASGLGGYVYWLSLNYFVAALVLRPRAALTVSLGWFAALLGIGAVYWLAPGIPVERRVLWGNALLQLYLSHLTLIAFLTVQGQLLRRYLRAIVHAEREARFANVDGLTGLANRRQLDLWLGEAGRGGADRPWSVILFDLDHFKAVNDAHGHLTGDRVLQAVAGAARSALGPGEQLGRWGGEEFLVVLPGRTQAQAADLAARLSEAVAAQEATGSVRVTVSCGVAQARPGEVAGDVLARADAAMYRAKAEGRARVRLAG
ncbi:diguanylate cyclase [Deinococcus sp. MIMF12]|uniref:Diguanylate cyclase n=1 Tax=Deinococcus rhizophilus TaxID=3049544 RepID=A0ABT7JJL8_9DEIO|nr:sensor domain-containing diguanylate cyclase [Deinococcus rhizophilus]MDL2345249.1 diguanylate cyclase [Deinococcus rhizophilus]